MITLNHVSYVTSNIPGISALVLKGHLSASEEPVQFHTPFMIFISQNIYNEGLFALVKLVHWMHPLLPVYNFLLNIFTDNMNNWRPSSSFKI
jgi:hypothetical protein